MVPVRGPVVKTRGFSRLNGSRPAFELSSHSFIPSPMPPIYSLASFSLRGLTSVFPVVKSTKRIRLT